MEPEEADPAGAAPGGDRHLQFGRPRQPNQAVEPPLPCVDHPRLDARGLRVRHAPRHAARRRHRPCEESRPQPDAVDHRLADDPDPGAGADPRGRRLQPPHRAAPRIQRLQPLRRQGADLDLPVVLPGHRRHGEGPPLAGADQSRPDAHLQRQPGAGVLEAPAAGLAAVPVHLAEGRHRREPRRRHRRRASDSGSYYSNSIQMWSALVVGSVLAALLVTAVGITERLVNRRMGARPA